MDQDLIARWSELGPIDWGRTDCAALCADELRRVSGVDPARDWRGGDGAMLYGPDAPSAPDDLLAAMRRAIERLPFERVPPADAPSMALGLAKPGNWTLGLCLGPGWWIFREEEGAMILRTEIVVRAWTWQPGA